MQADHPDHGPYVLACEGEPEWLFTENETNAERLFGARNRSPSVKDGIHDRVVGNRLDAVNPDLVGTKAAAWYLIPLEPGASASVRLRLSLVGELPDFDTWMLDPFADFERIFADRLREADEFYAELLGPDLGPEERQVARQAFAGMLWSKQFYHDVVERWLQGDPTMPAPPETRMQGRNHRWRHLWNEDVISMPEKWEYPWYSAWDLAFHCVTLALVDPDFAKDQKDQLLLLLREWYLHPNGQLPAYEWALAVLTNLFPVMAGLGFVVARFQWFEGSASPHGTYIQAMTVAIMLSLLFAISMDYEIFLLARIREAYDDTGQNRQAVVQGLATSGRVVVGAALVLLSVFIPYLFVEVRAMQELGTGLSVATLLDATVVRLVLVPSIVRILGHWNYWLPALPGRPERG